MNARQIFARYFPEALTKDLHLGRSREYDQYEVLVLSRIFTLNIRYPEDVVLKFSMFIINPYEPSPFVIIDGESVTQYRLYQVEFRLHDDSKKYMYILLTERSGLVPKVVAASYLSEIAKPDRETLTNPTFWMICNNQPIPLS